MKNLFLIAFWLVPFLALAQTNTGRVGGTLTDSTTAKPVPFATVALQTLDNQLINGVTTDDKGIFSIDKVAFGTYGSEYIALC